MTNSNRVTTTGDAFFRATPHPDDLGQDGRRAWSLRRVAGALSLPAVFLCLAVGTLIDPLDDSAAPGPTIDGAWGHAAAITTLAWVEMLTAVLTIAGLLTLVGAIRYRGAALANATGVLAVLTGIGLTAISFNHFVIAGLVGSGLKGADAVTALSSFQTAGGPVVILIMLPPLTYLIAALASWRAGLLPRAGLVLGVLFAMITSVSGSVLADIATIVVGLLLTGWMAKGLLGRRG